MKPIERFAGQSIRVDPERLWVQREGGLEPLSDSLHARCADAIVRGEDPAATEYHAKSAAHGFRADGRNGATVIAELLESMRARGYTGSPISVAINHEGRIVVTDGLHRASAHRALVPGKIPATIVYRAERWQALKYALKSLNDERVRLYQSIDHPDFDAWELQRPDTAARLGLVVDLVRGLPGGVELACNSGVFTCALARAGAKMLGLDIDSRAIVVARQLAEMHTIGAGGGVARFEWCPNPPPIPSADFVLCLSLFHHFQAKPERAAEGHEIFRRCVAAAPLVIFDCAAPGDCVGGDGPYTDPAAALEWCRASKAPGTGAVLALRGPDLQRTLLVWRR